MFDEEKPWVPKNRDTRLMASPFAEAAGRPTVAAPQGRRSPVLETMHSSIQLARAIDEGLSQLEEMLMPILRAPGQAEEAPPVGGATEFELMGNSHCRSLALINQRVRDLTERLAL